MDEGKYPNEEKSGMQNNKLFWKKPHSYLFKLLYTGKFPICYKFQINHLQTLKYKEFWCSLAASSYLKS